tara:strand:- start:2596 stop:3360 length:765 start_codon:yes stop_codon:yes gene_type:complete
MKKTCLFILTLSFLFSCSSKKQIIYFNDVKNNSTTKAIKKFNNNLTTGDILNIVVQTIVPEAAIPYNKISNNKLSPQNIDVLKIEGYLVDEFGYINFPVLGQISVLNLNSSELEKELVRLLLEGDHLSNPVVKVRRINSKFTVLGEVRNPGTFSYYDERINIFQALGYAGDLTIEGKRRNIKLIRESNGINKTFNFSLTDSELLTKPYYFLKNNDIIVIEPNFSKIKSAGFIGSPQSIASISSILLSITLLILN